MDLLNLIFFKLIYLKGRGPQRKGGESKRASESMSAHSSIYWLTYQMTEAGPGPSLEPGVSSECPTWMLWFILRCLPRHISRDLIGSGAAGAETGDHIGCWLAGSTLACRTVTHLSFTSLGISNILGNK